MPSLPPIQRYSEPMMNLVRTDWSHRTLLLSWTNRWLWVALAAMSIAWQPELVPAGLLLLTVYGLAQLIISILLFADIGSRVIGWSGILLDLLLPSAIVVLSAGQPAALLFLLLAPVIATSLQLGFAAGLLVGLIADATVASIWLSALFGFGEPFEALAWWLLVIIAGSQLMVGLIAERLAGLQLTGWMISGLARSELPAVATDFVDQLPPADLPMEGEQLLLTTLDLGLEVLTATGLNIADLSGLALVSDKAGLHEVGRSGLAEDGSFHFDSDQGALASARQHGSIENIPDLKRDPELHLLAEKLAWGSAACLPIEDGTRCLGVLVFGHKKRKAFDSERLEGLHALAQQARLALRFAELYQEQVQERIRLGEIQEEARKKLARDLHDGPTQVIAAIAMRTNFAKRQMVRDPEAAAQELAKVEEMARVTTREIRHMLFTLRPLILESQGLLAALRQFAEKVRETHQQQVLVESELTVEKALSQANQVALFYIIEEAVTNAYKHAAAEHIWISLQLESQEVVAEVRDDGVGFNVGEVDAHYEQRGSLGMVTMRERAELLEGNIEIESEVGQGTVIRVRIPANQALTSG